jgi:hypothetical protein
MSFIGKYDEYLILKGQDINSRKEGIYVYGTMILEERAYLSLEGSS